MKNSVQRKIISGLRLAAWIIAGTCCSPLTAQVISKPSIFWHNNQWETYENGEWRPYTTPQSSSPSLTPEAQEPEQGFEEPVFGPEENGMPQDPVYFYEPYARPPHQHGHPGHMRHARKHPGNHEKAPGPQLGTPNIGIGQPTIGIGKPNLGIGQTTIGIGKPNTTPGPPNLGIGQTTIGIGKPNTGLTPPAPAQRPAPVHHQSAPRSGEQHQH